MGRLTCEQCPAVDVRQVVGPNMSEAGIAVYHGRLRGWAELAYTDQHLGGRRAWFRCRQCERRCRLLYWRGEALACRLCHGLAYASQRERREYRLLGRAQAIRRRLGGTANLTALFPERPKGMHRSTYAQWRDKAIAAEHAGCAIIWGWLQQQQQRSARAIGGVGP